MTLNTSSRPLFRKEVLESRIHRLHGEVNISVPLSWCVISYGALFCFIIVLAFLSVAEYAQVTNVSGKVTLDKGVAEIVPSRTGVVKKIFVFDGQQVKAGQPLVQIISGEFLSGDITAPQKMLEAMRSQDKQLVNQSKSLLASSQAQEASINEQIKGLKKQISSLNSQIYAQKRLVYYADNSYKRLQKLAKKGLVSEENFENSASTLVTRQQELAQFEENLADKRSNLMTDKRQVTQYQASAAAQMADIASSRAQLAQQIAKIQSEQGYSLVAPFDGMVTGVTAKIGQPTSRQPLMLIIPREAKTEAELYVPTQSAGFLKAGQATRLLVDAFPYESFGTVRSEIKYISTAVVTKTNENGSTIPIYLVTVSIHHPWVMAFGEKQSLVPGMTLSARIVTRKQTLLEWLFEPLFAVSKR